MTIGATPTDPQAADLAAAGEENLFALFRAMAKLPGSELIEDDRLGRHLAFPSSPMFKNVWRVRLSPADADAAIAETIAWFSGRDSPYLVWWTGPSTKPGDLDERLVRDGLISMEEQQRQLARGIVSTAAGAPGKVSDLHRMNEAALAHVPHGFAIEESQDKPGLEDFKRVFVEANGVPEWAGQAQVHATLRLGIGRTPWRMYLGRWNDEPAATNMLCVGAGVASVYDVGAPSAVRGRDIAGAITLKPLLGARAGHPRCGALLT